MKKNYILYHKNIFLMLAIFLILNFSTTYAKENYSQFKPLLKKNMTEFLKTRSFPITNFGNLGDLLKILNIDIPLDSNNTLEKIIQMGKEQFEKGDKEGSVDIFKIALEKINNGGNDKNLLESLLEIAQFYLKHGDNKDSLLFFLKALDAAMINNDEDKVKNILKELEPLLAWQETVSEDNGQEPMPEEGYDENNIPQEVSVKLPDGKTAMIILPDKTEESSSDKKENIKKIDETKQKEEIKKSIKNKKYVVEKETYPGDILKCAGPPIKKLISFEDIITYSSWKNSYLNPAPMGRFAPYATDTGIDLVAPRGMPIYASKTGVLMYSAPSGHVRQRGPNDDQGAMRLHHPDGTDTFYAHLSGRRASLKPGMVVKQGEWMGNIVQPTECRICIF